MVSVIDRHHVKKRIQSANSTDEILNYFYCSGNYAAKKSFSIFLYYYFFKLMYFNINIYPSEADNLDKSNGKNNCFNPANIKKEHFFSHQMNFVF